jgi:hypothetical protein
MLPPFSIENDVYDGDTGKKLPGGWTGVVAASVTRERSFLYFGFDGEQRRTYNVLLSTNYVDAIEEARNKYLVPAYVKALGDVNDIGNAYIRASDNEGVDPVTHLTKARLGELSDAGARKAELLKYIAIGVQYPAPELMAKTSSCNVGIFGWSLDESGIIAYGNSRLECLLNWDNSHYEEYGKSYGDSKVAGTEQSSDENIDQPGRTSPKP